MSDSAPEVTECFEVGHRETLGFYPALRMRVPAASEGSDLSNFTGEHISLTRVGRHIPVFTYTRKTHWLAFAARCTLISQHWRSPICLVSL